MGARIAIALLAVCLLAGACDRGAEDEPPPAPTVPSTLPPEPETEECADLVDSALGVLQGQLDGLAAADVETLLDPDATLAPQPELDALAGDLEARSAELCSAGELGDLLAPRLGELRPVGPVAERYLALLADRLDG